MFYVFQVGDDIHSADVISTKTVCNVKKNFIVFMMLNMAK